MTSEDLRNFRSRSFAQKFGDAFRGVWWGVRGQNSFVVHGGATVAVVMAASFFRIELWEWCALGGCVAGVMSAELFNSALEELARAVDEQHNPQIGRALDIASGAVLLWALVAAALGAAIFAPHVYAWLGPG